MNAKPEHVALAVFASGVLLGGIGSWGIVATTGAALIAVFGTLSACGIATMLLAVVVYSQGLVEGEPVVPAGSSAD